MQLDEQNSFICCGAATLFAQINIGRGIVRGFLSFLETPFKSVAWNKLNADKLGH